MKCNHCSSEHMRKVSLVFEEQSQGGSFNGAFGGVGVGSGGVGVGAGVMGGTTHSQSLLAQRLLPPIVYDPPFFMATPFPWVSFIITIILLFLTLMFHDKGDDNILPETFWIFFLYRLFKYFTNKSRYAKYVADMEKHQDSKNAYRQWQNRWICMDCGEVNNPYMAPPPVHPLTEYNTERSAVFHKIKTWFSSDF